MIKNLAITNFRTHRLVQLGHLGRINVLLGMNNSGKTAALEALFFLSLPLNPREVLVRLNELRGYSAGTDFEETWDSLFYNWDHSQDISIEAEGAALDVRGEGLAAQETGKRVLRIRPLLGNGPKARRPPGVIEGSEFAEATRGLLFRYEDGRTLEREVTDLVRESGPRTQEAVESQRAVTFLPPRGIPDPQDEAQRFSRLEIANRHAEVVKALQAIEPRLSRLTVVATRQGSVLYGDVGTGHLMPVPLMGDGMLRTLSIALAMVGSKGGLVLLDEVENGLHHSVQTEVWRMIASSTRSLDVQVFATTHSDECIRSINQAMESLGYLADLRLYRFDLAEDGTRVTDYSSDALAAALESDQEVR